MKPTHILIPIKDIEDKIKTLTRFLEVAPTKLDQGKRQMLYELLDTGKQISLDEKDIEEKAKLKYSDSTYTPNPDIKLQVLIKQNQDNLIKRKRNIYSQALKDLL